MFCSDSTLLMADCFPVLKQLERLLHLSLSRCYQIHLAAITYVPCRPTFQHGLPLLVLNVTVYFKSAACFACSDVGELFPALTLLDMFGVVQSGHLSALKKGMPQVSINARPFSSISRPTPAGRASETTMWNRKCRLRFKL